MLEERERRQAGDWGRLKRSATWLLLGMVTLGVVGFIASGLYPHVVAVMFPEPAADLPAPAPVVARPSSLPGLSKADEDLAKQAGIPLDAPKAADGKVVDPEDLRFTMELLNFMQGRPQGEPTPQPKEGK